MTTILKVQRGVPKNVDKVYCLFIVYLFLCLLFIYLCIVYLFEKLKSK